MKPLGLSEHSRPDKGGYVNALGMSFRDFMDGKSPALPGVLILSSLRSLLNERTCVGEFPSMDDWKDHLTTIFPDVRLKTFLEMRGADGGPWRLICALPALWVGLMYDTKALAQASDLVSKWTQDDRDYLYTEARRHSLCLASNCVHRSGGTHGIEDAIQRGYGVGHRS